MAISAGVSFFYTLILSGSLAALARMAPQNIDDIIQQTAGLEGLLTQFYGVLIFLLLALGSLLPDQWPQKSKNESIIPVFVAVIGFILTIWLSVTTNWRIIHADIAFKMAEPFANSKQWVVANRLYRRAIEFSPDEDYYYLFLGRGSLEEAKTLTDPAQKEQAFLTAEADLLQAQKINPLNPDHTANLGRLHSWWALQTTDEAERIERGQVSDYYFSRVTVLSPNNARLWDEWAILNLNVLNDHNQAIDLLNHSLEIDPQYDWTLAILGDIYSQLGQQASDEIERKDNLEKAVEYYNRAITNVKTNLNYYFALAAAYQSLGNNLAVIDTLETSLAFANDSNTWQIQENLAHFYFQEGNLETALKYLQDAVNNAPESETERLQTTLDQLNP